VVERRELETGKNVEDGKILVVLTRGEAKCDGKRQEMNFVDILEFMVLLFEHRKARPFLPFANVWADDVFAHRPWFDPGAGVA